MPILNINNGKFYYEVHGEGSPLVLIAGLKGDHSSWMPVLGELSKHYQVLIFDNRGVGQTTDSDEAFTVETMADDVINLINAVGLNKPHIIGHSLGGAIAQQIAKKYSSDISSIVLSNTFAKFNDVGREVFLDILKLHEVNEAPADIMNKIAPWVFSKKFLTPEVIEVIYQATQESPYPQSLSGYKRQLQALYDFDSRSWVPSINLPTLVIGSDEDPVATLEDSHELASSITGAKLVTMSTGHGSLVEQPDVFIKHLNEFYKDIQLSMAQHECGSTV